ncbi:MAG: MdlB, multidrug/protein/lipid transporter ATPase, ATP-binding cassette, subfamily bacterial, partial [Candidatus Saccharibacteria bacterium]|nr:MdlB, multidrug/protein/lipid transporter ATPase, ATP-binding cassette, subfamily bacterial [Candidatus Saccharibacteria bacterium]
MNTSTPKQTLRIYWQYTKRHPKWLAFIAVLLPTLTLSEYILIPFFTAQILDKLATGASQLSQFYSLFWIIIALEIYAVIFWRVFVSSVWKLEISVMREMRQDVFKHLMNESSRFYSGRFGGALVSQAVKFVGAFERLFDTFVFNIATLILNYVFIIIILFPKAPQYVIALLIITLIFAFLMARAKKSERPLVTAEAQADTLATAHLADSMTNMMTIKTFANEPLEASLYGQKTNDISDRSLAYMKLSMRHEYLLAGLSRSLNVIAIVVAVWVVLKYKTPLGTMFLIVNYTGNLLRRMWDLSGIFKNINRVFGDAHEMTEILSQEPSIKDPDNPEPAGAKKGDIKIIDMCYYYPDQPEKPLFINFNLHIYPGEKVGLVGHSGSGKTTLTKLLLRLMDVPEGHILIDGQDISKMRQADIRKNIAYVPQEPLLFHRSIRENIRYGRLDATDEEIEEAARMAHADEFIKELPQG